MQPGEVPDLEALRERAEQVRDQLMPGLQAALQQAQEMQQKLMEAQEKLAASEVHGQAGGGLVQVTMKGSGQVVGVRIDPKVVDPDDIETLQDLIVGAIADASRQFAILAQTHLGSAGRSGSGGFPGLPVALTSCSAMFEGPVQDLIDELGKLPGIGPKSAQRIAFHLLSVEPPDIDRLTAALGGCATGCSSARCAATSPTPSAAGSAATPAATARRCAWSRSPRTCRPSNALGSSAGATTCWAAHWIRCPVSGRSSCEFVSCSTGLANGSTASTSPR